MIGAPIDSDCLISECATDERFCNTVVTNVIYYIYNFEKTGYLRLFMPRRLFTFFRNNLIFKITFSKLTKLSIERFMLQTWKAQSIRKQYSSLKVSFAVHYFIY